MKTPENLEDFCCVRLPGEKGTVFGRRGPLLPALLSPLGRAAPPGPPQVAPSWLCWDAPRELKAVAPSDVAETFALLPVRASIFPLTKEEKREHFEESSWLIAVKPKPVNRGAWWYLYPSLVKPSMSPSINA